MTNVIACIDGSTASPAVCDYAAWSSRQMEAPLVLLHVLDKSEFPSGKRNLSGNLTFGNRESLLNELAELDAQRNKLALEQGRLMLEDAYDRVKAAGVAEADRRQRHGDLLETLVELQEETRLLVLGKEGEHTDSLGEHIGSNVESVVRTVQRPVLVTTTEYTEPRRIMIAFDGGDTTRKCVEMVAGSPLFKGLPVHIVMVGDEKPENQAQLDWARQTLEAAGFEALASIQAGDVETVLCNYRKEHAIDLIVMGAYGHSRIRQFFVGSTTANVVRHAHVPVLLLR
ncbi:MAG: universal stress protein [Gammaproteobacteria bacterium]|nr:universal stress protein [Gammaproteobacteria bacterium]